jgi:hypothetical protein
VQLNKKIDEQLPGRPRFRHHEVVVNGEVFELYSCDILECIHALWGDTDFTPHLILVPERHYTDADHANRMFHNMHTAEWWWRIQVCVPMIIIMIELDLTL